MSNKSKQDPAASTDEVEIVEQPALPTLELPDYHGRKPVGMKSSVNGASNRLSRPHGIGDRITVVVEAVVKRAGHEQTDDGLIYTETLKVDDMFEIQGDAGARLLSTVRSLHRTANDSHEGRAAIDELGEAGYTDGSGVVLTPREVAELRGDPVRAMLSDELTPVVVKYESGARMVWPDEYPKNYPRPNLDQAHPDDHEEGVDADRVAEILHHATGEPLLARAIAEAAADVDDWEGGAGDHRPAETEPEAADFESVSLDDGVEPFEADHSDDPALSSLPTKADFVMVDTTVPKLREITAGIADRILLERLLMAEKQGRGRGLIPRKGAIEVIEARLGQVER